MLLWCTAAATGAWSKAASGGTPKAQPKAKIDHGIFDSLLKKHVSNGWVDYRGFKQDEAELDRYLKALENTDTGGLSRNEQFAFYINAYNAWTVKLILSGYPGIGSIKDLARWPSSPWKKKISRLDGQVITLDNIEHDILRPRFKDPRVHFAVNCASKGCPPLRSEAYLGSALDRQLDDSTRRFINDPRRTRLEGKKLYVSKIFKWFSVDFKNDILGFVLRYASGDLEKELNANRDKIKIKYLDYDWGLNGE
jgi:hypothetical protein